MKPTTLAVTVTALGTLACAGAPDIVVKHTNPPPVPLPTDYDEDGELPNTLLPTEAIHRDDFTHPMNVRDPQGRTVYRGYHGCYVELPYVEPPSSWHPPPTLAVPCGPKMGSVLWTKCREGTITTNQDRSACICDVDGNPPPPTTYVHCPEEP